MRASKMVALVMLLTTRSVAAQEQMLFPATDDALSAIVQRINNERVRIDVASWYFTDRTISIALINRFRAGVPVRVISDWLPAMQTDPNTVVELQFLASAGIPIRLRYNPTWFPQVMHWKAGIFVGQNTVEFGSGNWTTFELTPWSSTNFDDETAMFTNDPDIFHAFLTQFDRMWADTTTFMDYPDVYRLFNGVNWPTPMTINHARLEPDYPTPTGMIWSQGPELNNVIAAQIDAEPSHVDMVIYRLSDPVIRDAAIRRLQAGVPVRMMVEPSEYRRSSFPEYWLTGAMVDQLWVAGAQIRQRVHDGLTHMKTIITSSMALNGSSNFTTNWQRDHNYWISATSKPALYFAVRDRFNAMWNDGVHYGGFQPLPPSAAPLVGPSGSGSVTRAARLDWSATPWAVAFDVYLGTSSAALAFAGRVNAVLSDSPPPTYSFTPPLLSPNTTYYWRVVSRTFATDVIPSLVANSDLWSFTTGTSTAAPSPLPPPPAPNVPPPPPSGAPVSAPPPVTPGSALPAPSPAAPSPGSPSTCTTPRPAADWTCVNGGWLPPGMTGGAPAPAPAPSTPTAPATSSCTSVMPGPGWVCSNGGWLPPGMAPAAPAPAPSAPTPSAPVACTTTMPGPGWSCVNGGWLPPGMVPSSAPTAAAAPTAPPTGCSTPDPFVAFGGGICVGGGWIPKNMR